QRCFRAYSSLMRLFLRAYETAEIDEGADEGGMLSELERRTGRAGPELDRFGKLLFLGVFRYFAVWLVLIWLAVPLVALQGQLGVHGITYLQAGEAALAGSVFLLGLRYLVRRQATPPALSISQTLAQGRRLHDACKAKAEVHYQEEIGRIKEEYLSISQTADQELKRSLASAGDLRVKCRMESDQRTVRVTAKNERMYRAWLERLERQHTAG